MHCRGPLGWLVPSEIQPLETRAAGTGLNTFVNLIMTFVVGQTFLSMLCAMKFGVSGFALLWHSWAWGWGGWGLGEDIAQVLYTLHAANRCYGVHMVQYGEHFHTLE